MRSTEPTIVFVENVTNFIKAPRDSIPQVLLSDPLFQHPDVLIQLDSASHQDPQLYTATLIVPIVVIPAKAEIQKKT